MGASSLHVLVIGGTRFVGSLLVWRLLAGGHRVALVNRGTRPDSFGDRVQRLVADRTTDQLARVLAGRRFDAVVDFAAYDGSDIERAIEALDDRIGHYVFIGSGQVYLVREPRPARAAVEADYEGPVMAAPQQQPDLGEWEYGVGKRACEAALARAGVAATVLRLPMINGERDYYRRIESYLWRLLDGEPLLVPDGGDRPVRHVYGDEVARFICSVLGRRDTMGRAYNLAQRETPTLRELLSLLGERLGCRPVPLVAAATADLERAGLDPRAASPFSTPWMSFVDPSRARDELGFEHRPLEEQLHAIVASFTAHPPASPPPGYAQRPRELELALRLG